MNFVVYVPKGKYLIGRPVVAYQKYNYSNPYTDTCCASNRKHSPIMVGDATGGSYPVLKAADGAIGSGTLITYKFINDPSGSEDTAATRFYAAIFRGFKIDMGNNPNATALSMSGAQLCSIEDVRIVGNFKVGIHDLPGSGGSTTNVRIVGGQVGILQNGYRPTPSIQGLELSNQAQYGIDIQNVRNGIVVAGFKIFGSGTAGVRVANGRSISMADGSFDLAADVPAIAQGKSSPVYLNKVYARTNAIVAGTDSLDGVAGTWTGVEHFGTGISPIGVTQVSAPPTRLVGLHAWIPKKVPTYFNADVLDIRDYGATPDVDADDDAPAINRALIDSAAQNRPVFVPRGRFSVEQTIEVPVGASMIGSSFTNSMIWAKASWLPTEPTALLRTADAVGSVLLMDFAVVGHEPARARGLTAHNNMIMFVGRTSNMLVRDVQITRKEYFAGGDPQWGQTIARFTGNAGGRIYNLAFDYHETYGTPAGAHNMFQIYGTRYPLAFYQPNTESGANNPQVVISNAKNVTLYGFKYERADWYDLLDIENSSNIGVIGGAGNYSVTRGDQMFLVKDSAAVAITNQLRKGSTSGGSPMLVVDGQTLVDYNDPWIRTYLLGRPKLFGSLRPPGFPSLGSPRQRPMK
jgi:hypothetical protein